MSPYLNGNAIFRFEPLARASYASLDLGTMNLPPDQAPTSSAKRSHALTNRFRYGSNGHTIIQCLINAAVTGHLESAKGTSPVSRLTKA
jgi:hypothetical protein